MTLPIRRRNATFAVKFQTAEGVDAFGGGAPSLATDYLKGDFNPTWSQQAIANPELTGTLDDSPSIAGGTKVSVQLTVMLKGSGAPGVAPQWGKLMQLCAMQEVVTAAAIGPAAASAGSATTSTLGNVVFAATAQAYRGMPAILSSPTEETMILDYSAGKVARLAHRFSPVLDDDTIVTVPANVLYRPISDAALEKVATLDLYQDGLRWRLLDCAGTWKADVNAGGVGTLTFTISGVYCEPVAAAVPVGAVFDATQPPVFRAGMSRLNGNVARISKASWDGGGTIFEPENPEAPEGFDPPIITKRAAKGTFDPLMSVAETIARVASFKAGEPQTAAISWGTVPGNRIAIGTPRAQYTGFGMTNRSELMAENLPFDCSAPDASIFVCCY